MAKMDRRSSYTTAGIGKAALMKGLTWLGALAKVDPSKANALVAVTTKTTLKNFQADLEAILGKQAVKALAADDNTVKWVGGNLKLFTTKDKMTYGWKGPVLAIYPSKELLDKVDELYDVTDVLVIPSGMPEVQLWIDQWQAKSLEGGPEQEVLPVALHPVVTAALQHLTATVNLKTGIIHSSDHQKAVEMFETLHLAGFDYKPAEIRAWLVGQGGWGPKDADEVAKLAADMAEGKKLRGKAGKADQRLLDYWAEKIAEAK
jgi:hypothetical protein